jgi:hypothetical protein
MVSGYVPAVDLHASFAATDVPLVTVLVPIPQGQTYAQRVTAFSKTFNNGQTRITLRFSDETAVEYVVAGQPTELNAGPVKAPAEALLTMTRVGVTEGLALSRAGDSYAFTLVNGTLRRSAAITVPTGFNWRETTRGALPEYR